MNTQDPRGSRYSLIVPTDTMVLLLGVSFIGGLFVGIVITRLWWGL